MTGRPRSNSPPIRKPHSGSSGQARTVTSTGDPPTSAATFVSTNAAVPSAMNQAEKAVASANGPLLKIVRPSGSIAGAGSSPDSTWAA
jgi:hypothetical protein